MTGTFGGSLRNGANNRGYAFTYAITAAGPFQKFRITIPGDTAGTWAVADNAKAAVVTFSIGCGATNSGAPNVWTASPLLSATGAVSVVGTMSAGLYITGVALMVGAAAANAEPEFRKYADNLIDCQRYFSNIFGFAWGGYNISGQQVVGAVGLPVMMRALPTIVLNTTSYSNSSGLVTFSVTQTCIPFKATITATGAWFATSNITADADF
jgi:hypothetical protein